MNVKNTESRLPANYTASDLGPAAESSDKTYALVSFVPSPIRRDPGLPYWNHYVAFADTQSAPTAIDYEWKLEFLDKDGQVFHTETDITNDSEFFFDSTEYILAEEPARLQVSISYKNGSTQLANLALTHDLAGTEDDIINFLELADEKDKTPSAFLGNPAITRFIANSFRPYLTTELSNHNSGIPANLPANILYQQLLAVKQEISFANNNFARHLIKRSENSNLKDEINKPEGSRNISSGNVAKLNARTGLCRIKPHLSAMFLMDPNDSSPYLDLKILGQATVTENTILDDFGQLDLEHLIDIYNLLRFPKSSIRICCLLLDELRKRHSDKNWKDIGPEDFAAHPEMVKTILWEYYRGPTAKPKTPLLVRNTFRSAWASYIEKLIVRENYIPTQRIKILVLDLRSGKPIKNTKIKDLILYTQKDGQAYTSFAFGKPEYLKDEIVTASLIDAQTALYLMGYFPDGETGLVNGNWNTGAVTNHVKKNRAAFNQYLQDRALPFSYADNADEPKDYILKHIVDEYNSHRATNADGVLELRLPLTLLEDRKVYVDVGFPLFPVVKEKLKNHDDAKPGLHRQSVFIMDPATNFKARWIGGQEADWDKYYKTSSGNDIPPLEEVHFGWKVHYDIVGPVVEVSEDNLKVFERIVIKDDYKDFLQLDSELFSRYYDPNAYPFPFVLFGMQWCQPVWDGITDSDNAKNYRSTKNTFINRKINGEWRKDLSMHMVTMYLSGKNDVYGHYYGFYSDSPPCHRTKDGVDKVHRGIDLYSGPDGHLICFASHGGQLQNRKGYGFGYWAKIWMGKYLDSPNYILGHLKQATDLNDEDFVMAGQVVGKCGRTYGHTANTNEPWKEFPKKYPSHLHFELRTAAGLTTSIEPSSFLENGNPNQVVLPDNRLPLMLPCKEAYGGSYEDPKNCRSSKKSIATHCWAIREFPYDSATLNKSSNNNPSKHQEKFINEDDVILFACPYLHYKPTTFLANPLNDSETPGTIAVTDAGNFPGSGQLLIKEEIISYTGKDGNTFTGCTRGDKGTALQQHTTTEPISYLNFEIFWVQAHLKFVFANKGKGGIPDKDFADPGGVDGSRGTVSTELDVESGDTVSVKEKKHNDKLVKVEKDGKVGWVSSSLVDSDNKMTKPVKNLPEAPGSTAVALYFFREEEGMISESDYDDYKQLFFEIDKALMVKLRDYMTEIPID